ncbi:MAG TPA: pyridoxamine 5'-phosphate oxidase family protein [Anaeromyxobacteraceae bacterium]|nr:pyridoxamine 5'-phosphate oxidase family protein [Anaeromyxobacteraceae bacterium]
MIPAELRAALAQEGSAAFVTHGPDGPHLVATWNSYLRVLDDATVAFPAGGYRKTEENVRAGSDVQMILGAKNPTGIGFRMSGRAEFQVGTPVHQQLKATFPWCRAAVLLHVTRVEKVLG